MMPTGEASLGITLPMGAWCRFGVSVTPVTYQETSAKILGGHE